MTRPTPDSTNPYTRGDVASLTGLSVTTIKSLQKGRVLPKRARGAGNWDGFNDDDLLRAMLAKECLRVGLQVASIHSLFAAIEQPTAPNVKPWSWLDSPESREKVACLVLVLSHRAMTSATGAAYLTTFEGAKQWLGNRTAIVIDVASFIREIEERTGRPFQIAKPTGAKGRTN